MPQSVDPIKWTNHRDYFRLALENWGRIQILKREHDALEANIGRDPASDDAIADQLAAKNDEIGKLALVVVVFAAFALEAKNYFKNYLDKLDVAAKWIVVPRLVTGDQLPAGSREMQDLAWLVALRNALAHFKSKELALADIRTSDFLWYEDADGDRVKVMALEAKEFLRRFLLHVVPDGFVRIRHFGVLANRTRKAKLARCRQLLAQPPAPAAPLSESVPALMLRLTGVDIARCGVCHRGRLHVIEIFPPTPRPPHPVSAWDTS